MNSFAFDTHAFFKSLTYAGMEEQQAEALVEFQTQLINESLATKRDIEEVKESIGEVKESVEALRLKTEQSIEEVKASVEALRLKTEQSIEEVKESIEALRLKTEQSIEKLKVELEKVKGEVAEVKGEVEKLRLEIKRDIKALELHLTLRLASVIILTTGLFATLVKWLP